MAYKNVKNYRMNILSKEELKKRSKLFNGSETLRIVSFDLEKNEMYIGDKVNKEIILKPYTYIFLQTNEDDCEILGFEEAKKNILHDEEAMKLTDDEIYEDFKRTYEEYADVFHKVDDANMAEAQQALEELDNQQMEEIDNEYNKEMEKVYKEEL